MTTKSTEQQSTVTVNVASSSKVKLGAVQKALTALYPSREFNIRPCPVELQAREGADVNAQPYGADDMSETIDYAEWRLETMIREHGKADVNIAIESGALGGSQGLYNAQDVAVTVLETASGSRQVLQSRPIAFPVLKDEAGIDRYPLIEANRRGFKATTGGDIIHELRPDVPGNSWQEYFPGPDGTPLSRVDQIADSFAVNETEVRHTLQTVMDTDRPTPTNEVEI